DGSRDRISFVVLLLHRLLHLPRALDGYGGSGLQMPAAPELLDFRGEGLVRRARADDHGSAQREPGDAGADQDEDDRDQSRYSHGSPSGAGAGRPARWRKSVASAAESHDVWMRNR